MTQASRRNDAAAVVLLEERRTASGHVLGIATLNSAGTLNSLSLQMIGLLAPQLAEWNARSEVVAVLLRGAGDRAFCAGGDVRALYRAITRNRAAGKQVDDGADRFFEAEYRLDYALHRSRKPVICLGHGVVMGGGLGLFSASRYRLVTGQSRIAMPEVSIGLFPDAGVSWLLKKLPYAYGAFLGMTGTPLDAADALHTGLATHAIAAGDWEPLVDALAGAAWTGEAGDASLIESCIGACARPQLPGSALEAHRAVLESALADASAPVAEAVQRLERLAGHDEWLDRGIATLRSGCPTSVGIVHEQLRRVAGMTLADAFRMELCVATHCARNPDFAEGVRALIIDKDNKPAWRYAALANLPHDYVTGHFAAPWASHPLADLGEH